MIAHKVLHSTNISLPESSSFIAETLLVLPPEAEGRLRAGRESEFRASKYTLAGFQVS